MTMSDSVEVLVDTSAWIDYFCRREPHHSLVARLLDEERICCVGLILGELLQGAKGKQELAALRGFSDVFPFVGETVALWVKAGELSAKLRRTGTTIGLADCFIAVAAMERGAAILTGDGHFDQLSQTLGLERVQPDAQKRP